MAGAIEMNKPVPYSDPVAQFTINSMESPRNE